MTTSGTIIVYQITNLVNGDFYIGVASGGLRKRRREHLCVARRGKSKLKLYRAIRKYGEDNFQFSVMEECESFDRALEREIALIAEMSPAYNLTRGGQGVVGAVRSQETREKLRQAKLGTVGYWRGKKRPDLADAARVRMLKNPLNFWTGKKRSAETIEKIRKTKTGVPRAAAPPHALAIFADNMRRAAAARRKPVRCLNDGVIYPSASAASLAYGFQKTTVAAVAGGRRAQSGGLRFEYV